MIKIDYIKSIAPTFENLTNEGKELIESVWMASSPKPFIEDDSTAIMAAKAEYMNAIANIINYIDMLEKRQAIAELAKTIPTALTEGVPGGIIPYYLKIAGGQGHGNSGQGGQHPFTAAFLHTSQFIDMKSTSMEIFCQRKGIPYFHARSISELVILIQSALNERKVLIKSIKKDQ